MEPFHDLISDSRNLSNAVTDRGMRLTRQLPDFTDDMVEYNLNSYQKRRVTKDTPPVQHCLSLISLEA